MGEEQSSLSALLPTGGPYLPGSEFRVLGSSSPPLTHMLGGDTQISHISDWTFPVVVAGSHRGSHLAEKNSLDAP